jgi:hypothetical protein
LVSGKIDKLPPIFAKSEVFANAVLQISAAIKRGEVNNEKDASERLRLINEKGHWKRFNDPANFLKHADQDPDRIFALDKVDNELLFLQAIAAYIEVMGKPTWEMIVYTVFRVYDIETFSPKLKEIAKQPVARRRRACQLLLRELKKRGAAALG